MNNKGITVGCGGMGSNYTLRKALEFIKSMSAEEWQEYEKSLNFEPLDMPKYEDDGFTIVDYSGKTYFAEVFDKLDNMTDEEFDELLIESGIENRPYKEGENFES